MLLPEFDIEYCPTEQMLADYFTKPLQGSLFRRFREVIMGWNHIDTLKTFLKSTKECVGNGGNDKSNEFSDTKTIIKKVTYADAVRELPDTRDKNSEHPENERGNALILRN